MWLTGAFLSPIGGALNMGAVTLVEIQGTGNGSAQFHMADGSTLTRAIAATDADAQTVLDRITQAIDPADFI